jgi:hypothetical protein
MQGFNLAYEFLRPAPVKWNLFDGSKQVQAQLPFSEVTEIAACREDVPSCLLDLILTFEGAHKSEEIFILHVSCGNNLQPLLLHPQVSNSTIINGLVNSRSLKVKTVSSTDELLQTLDTLQRHTEPDLKVLLMLDRLDDLFAVWRRDEKKESLSKHDIALRRRNYIVRESLSRSPGRKYDFWPEADPFYLEDSLIPQCMDKLTNLLSTKQVVATWIRSKSGVGPRHHGKHLVKEERNGPRIDGWRDGEVLWSPSLRHGPVGYDGKLSPYGEAWKERVPNIVNYATAGGAAGVG